MKALIITTLVICLINSVFIVLICLKLSPTTNYTMSSVKSGGSEIPLRINNETGETEYYIPGKGWIKDLGK